MTNITIEVRGADARKTSQEGILTTGMVGAVVKFQFSEEWENLDKTAIFAGGPVKVDKKIQGEVTIPPESLNGKGNLRIGVEGRSADGSIVIPTVWVEDVFVRAGANATGNPASAPEVPNWARAVLFAPQELSEDQKAQARKNIGVDAGTSGGGGASDGKETVSKEYVDEVAAGKIDAPPTASIGQTIVVKAVDETGKPTEWEASDLPSGGRTAEWMKIANISVVPDDGVEKYIIDKDENGNTFSFNEIMIVGTLIDHGGKLNIWFNRQDMVFADAVAISNFFDFRNRVAVQINRLHDDVFGVLSYGLGKPSDVAYLEPYFTGLKKTKIESVVLSRPSAASKGTITVYGR